MTTTTTKPPAKDWQQPLQLAQALITRLSAEASRLKSEFGVETPQRIRYCVVDDVLPPSVMEAAYSQLPKLGDMVRRADMRERKYVSANIGKLDGVPKYFLVYVLKKDGCVYDFWRISEPGAGDVAPFEAFVKGFATES